jgi:integrase
MSLYRVGRIWYADIQIDGRRFRGSTGTADKKAAQEWHDRRRAELWRESRIGDPVPRRFREAMTSWLAEKPRDASDRYRLRALPAWLRETRLADLTTERMDSAIEHMAPSSYNRTANLLRAILHHAQGRGWIAQVPALPRKRIDDKRLRWLSAEEWERLRAELPEPLRSMARFTLATGLRENNVIGLRWDQVDMARAVAWVHADEAKAGSAIGVPLNADALATLQERAGDERRCEWVFANPETLRPYYKASMRAWYDALRRAGLEDVRWHDLRHTWASWHVMRGTRLEELQRLGGWKTLAMVTRYAHLSPEHLAGVARNVAPVSVKQCGGSGSAP